MSHSALTTDLPHASAALERVDEAYSDPAWWYNLRGFGILTFAYRTSVWSQVSFLERNLSTNHLEIPVGTGTLMSMVLWWRVTRKGPLGRIVAVDYSQTMVDAAREAFRKWTTVEVARGDVANLAYDDNSFDSINIANGFHCFPDPEGALQETFRVLKPGGTLATNVLLYPRGPQPLRWIAHKIDDWGKRKGLLVEPFELDDIRNRFLQAGFTIDSEDVRGNTVNLLARKDAP